MSTTLKSILDTNDLDGKIVRRKLRADAKKSTSPIHGHEHRSGWTFDAKQVTHVRALLGIATKAEKPAKKKIVKRAKK